MTSSALREVLCVAFNDFQMLDVAGPLEVFSYATRLLTSTSHERGYRLHMRAPRGQQVASSSGLVLCADGLGRVPQQIDTLIVAGGRGVDAAARDAELVPWVRRAAARSRRVASICTGAFILAEAGLLEGRRATTHWNNCADLATRFPNVRVEPNPIFVKDGSIYTSAGVTAGIDLALALVAEDHGRGLGLKVAQRLVVFLQRPGGQAQFSTQLAVQIADRDALSELRAWMEDHLDDDLTADTLARRAGMSARNFARRFTAEVGKPPAKYVTAVRLAAVRRRLQESSCGLKRIAAETGFRDVDTLRRVFFANFGITPSAYRARFSTEDVAAQ